MTIPLLAVVGDNGMPHRSTGLLVILALVAQIAVSPFAAAAAQDAGPAETEPAGATIRDPLFQAALEQLPESPALLRLVLVTLDPGADVPLHTHPGPSFVRIESGPLTVEVAGPAVVAPADAGGVAVQAPVDEAFELVPGDQIVYPAETPFAFSNRTDRPIQLLSLLIVPAGEDRPPVTEWIDGTPEAGSQSGVVDDVLGQAIALAWPPSPLVVVADRLALGPGEDIPASPGPVMLAVETGSLGFNVLDGEFQISRGADDLEAIASPTGDYRLGSGDAVYFPAGISAVPRAPADGLLVLVRLSILPLANEAPDGTPTAGATVDDARSVGIPATGGSDAFVRKGWDRDPLGDEPGGLFDAVGGVASERGPRPIARSGDMQASDPDRSMPLLGPGGAAPRRVGGWRS